MPIGSARRDGMRRRGGALLPQNGRAGAAAERQRLWPSLRSTGLGIGSIDRHIIRITIFRATRWFNPVGSDGTGICLWYYSGTSGMIIFHRNDYH